jgi:hypothetical protein
VNFSFGSSFDEETGRGISEFFCLSVEDRIIEKARLFKSQSP